MSGEVPARGWIIPYRGVMPTLGERVFIAPGATVLGNTTLGDDVSIWFGCVLRGDVHTISVGARSNIQDGTIVHVTKGEFPTAIGEDVLVGHACVIHGCTLKDRSFIGMGATLLDGVVVESEAMVAAGALVTPGKVVPTGELWGGRPAKLLRLLSAEERANFGVLVQRYVDLAHEYREAGIGA